MPDLIQEMRDRLVERFSGTKKPIQGLRVTADNTPRLPQSRIPTSRPRYDIAGRPPKVTKSLPENVPLQRKKPRDIFGGWL
jgi:hypothetical protein